MDKIVGRFFSSETMAERLDTGDWKVTVSMIERRLLDGDNQWEDKRIDSSCTDSDFESAYGVAMNATLQKFDDLLHETNGNGMFMPFDDDKVSEVKEATPSDILED